MCCDRVCVCAGGSVFSQKDGHEVRDGAEIGSLCRLDAFQTHRHVSRVFGSENNGVPGFGEFGAVVSAEAFTVDGHSEKL